MRLRLRHSHFFRSHTPVADALLVLILVLAALAASLGIRLLGSVAVLVAFAASALVYAVVFVYSQRAERHLKHGGNV